jgi:hypothetical protein
VVLESKAAFQALSMILHGGGNFHQEGILETCKPLQGSVERIVEMIGVKWLAMMDNRGSASNSEPVRWLGCGTNLTKGHFAK